MFYLISPLKTRSSPMLNMDSAKNDHQGSPNQVTWATKSPSRLWSRSNSAQKRNFSRPVIL